MRRKSLKLSVTEQLNANQIFESIGFDPKKCFAEDRNLSSKLRVIPHQTTVTISSIEDEIEMMSNKSISAKMLSRMPSLIFLSQLDSESIDSVLKEYSARDLSSAWIGPPTVLERLAATLPAKKKELLYSYTESVEPRRDSAAFSSLVKRAAAYIKNEESNPSERDEGSSKGRATGNAA
ncbi:MAG: hypothetical protein NT027_12480 [Proteobacteria bacterium]|nr:hypothetical protein [Pseudomonadota bacterium]